MHKAYIIMHRKYVIMHDHYVLTHKHFVIMHKHDVIMHKYYVIMHKLYVIMHSSPIFLPLFVALYALVSKVTRVTIDYFYASLPIIKLNQNSSVNHFKI